MKTKTSELERAALNWAVAECEGIDTQSFLWAENQRAMDGNEHYYNYSTNWLSGGPIIEREGIELLCESLGFRWVAIPQKGPEWRGPTPLIAAMRCYVASKLGAEVDVPELLEG